MAENLTKNQVQDLIDFANGVYYGEQYGMWSPFLSNSLLQNLSGPSREATSKAVREALANCRNDAETIHSYMDFMTTFSHLTKI